MKGGVGLANIALDYVSTDQSDLTEAILLFKILVVAHM